MADVRAVGVQAFPGALGGRGLGVFAIATTTVTANPANTEWDVLLDVDEDGTPDYGVIGIDLGIVAEEQLIGTFASVTVDLRNDRIVGALAGGGGLDTSVVLLPFDLAHGRHRPGRQPDASTTSPAPSPSAPPTGPRGSTSSTASPPSTPTGSPSRPASSYGWRPGQSVTWTARLRSDAAVRHAPLGLLAVYLENPTGVTAGADDPRPPARRLSEDGLTGEAAGGGPTEARRGGRTPEGRLVAAAM